MQYNLHIEKYKSSDIGGIHAEQFREFKNETSYKNYVDPEKTKLNQYLALTNDGADWRKHIKQAIKETTETTGRAVRKDAVTFCSAVESVPKSWDSETCTEYFQAKAEWLKKYFETEAGLDPDKFLSCCIHLDETTPHATYVFIPGKDGKLQAKNILNRNFLKRLQTDSQAFTFEWIEQKNLTTAKKLEKLEPIQSGSKRKHLEESEYKEKQISTNVENLEQHHKKLEEKIEEANKEILEKSNAPDIRTYKDVVNENENLKIEIGIKDRLIKELQQAVESWKTKAEHWKSTFDDVASKAGSRLLKAFGYESNTPIQEYPTINISDATSQIQSYLKNWDAKSIRIVSDHNLYKAIIKDTDGSYKTIKDGFVTRQEAEVWKNNLHTSQAVNKLIEEDIDKKLKIK